MSMEEEEEETIGMEEVTRKAKKMFEILDADGDGQITQVKIGAVLNTLSDHFSGGVFGWLLG